MNKLVSGAVGFEIELFNGVGKYFLPEIMYLREKRIKHIDFCFASDLTTTPKGIAVNGLVNDVFITLRETNTQEEKIQALPITELNASGNRLYINKIIDMTQSFIEITAPLNNLNNTAFYLVFWYDEPKIWNMITKSNRTTIESFDLVIDGTKTYFRDFRTLVNKKIQNILLSLPTVTPTGITGITDIDLKTLYLTLSKENYEFFSDVPLYLFFQANQNFKLRLQNISFDFQKSYILDKGNNNGKAVFFNAVIDDNFF